MAIPGLDINANSEEEVDVFSHFQCPPVQKPGDIRPSSDFQRNENVPVQFSALACYRGMDLKKGDGVIITSQKDMDHSMNRDPKNFLRELETLRCLNNENIHKFKELALGQEMNRVYFIYEDCVCVISQLLKENVDWLKEPAMIKNVTWQLFKGLWYLHRSGIAHRDIHPENLLMHENGLLKITNFRIARRLDDFDKKVITAEFRYQPIDQLLENEFCSKAVDVWAATLVFARLILGEALILENGRENVIGEIFQLLGYPTQAIWKEFFEIPALRFLKVENYHAYNLLPQRLQPYRIPPSASILIRGGLRYNPLNRFQVDACLRSNYFNEEPKVNGTAMVDLTQRLLLEYRRKK